MSEPLTLWGLFLSSFISSTIFPGGSEIVLGALARGGAHDPLTLLWVASTGNTLGALSTFLLGRLIAAGVTRRKSAASSHQVALERVRRFGGPVLLLSWLPVVGDPLCLAAGVLRLSWWSSTLYIAAGKVARYALVLWLLA